METKLIIDTREKKINHIISKINSQSISFIRDTLKYGDYSFIYNDKNYSKSFVIERKANLDELAINFTKERDRFKREFEKAKKDGCMIVLLIEDDFSKIKKHAYRSKFHPNAFLASLKSWKSKGLIDEIYFGDKKETATFMIELFQEYLKNAET